MLTEKRKQEIFTQARNQFLRDVNKREIAELENEYGIKADSYSCYACVYNFIVRCIRIDDKRKEAATSARAVAVPEPAKRGRKPKAK